MSVTPITIGVISTFIWCSVCAFSASSRYLLTFSFSFITTRWSLGTTTPLKYNFLASLFLIVMSCLLCLTFQLISTSHSIPALPLAEVDYFSGIWWYHFLLHSIPHIFCKVSSKPFFGQHHAYLCTVILLGLHKRLLYKQRKRN